MTALKILNLLAVGIYTCLAILTFVDSGASDAAGRGMAQGFAVVILGIACVGLVCSLLNFWTTQIIALVVLLIPIGFVMMQRYDAYRYAQDKAAEADGRAYFAGPPLQALAAAIHAEDLLALEENVPHHKQLINEVGPGKWTLLDTAINRFFWTRTEGSLRIIAFLLAQGADPNIHSPDKNPLITETEVIVEAPIFTMLVEHGADPNSVDLQGRPVLWIVVASFGEEADKVRLLLQHGAQPDFLGSATESPLVVAARRRHWVNCLLLLEHGAEPHAPEAAEFWKYYDDNARSYKHYNDAPPAFLQLSQHPAIQAARP